MDHERVLCVDCLMKNCEEECRGRSVCLCASVYVWVCVCVWVLKTFVARSERDCSI